MHFEAVRAGLSRLGVASELSPRLVRGFDYYTRTTFEFVADALDGAQNAIGGEGATTAWSNSSAASPPAASVSAAASSGSCSPWRPRAHRSLLSRPLEVFVVDITGEDAAGPWPIACGAAGVASDRAYDSVR